MITDRSSAETRVGAALTQIAPDLNSAGLAAAKQTVGRVMGEFLVEPTKLILKVHPEFLPEGWKELAYCKD